MWQKYKIMHRNYKHAKKKGKRRDFNHRKYFVPRVAAAKELVVLLSILS